jgi:hypothetical protein
MIPQLEGCGKVRSGASKMEGSDPSIPDEQAHAL